jgi:hypothetical protein
MVPYYGGMVPQVQRHTVFSAAFLANYKPDRAQPIATMDIDRPSVEERSQHYKPGSIKRVKLKNFLTYDAVEFFPGPR